MTMKKRALLSVSDKTGILDFARGLVALGYEIISTGGTATALHEAGIQVLSVSAITGFPECLDGRVKTLHPFVHAGILALRESPEHMAQLEKLKVNTIDIVAVNLYPFAETIAKPDVSRAKAVEFIDIGGPSMLRSAAKNCKDVLSLCDPSDYTECLERLKTDTVDLCYRMKLMYKVFTHTAAYDAMISEYIKKEIEKEEQQLN